jgi:hypothetical protein
VSGYWAFAIRNFLLAFGPSDPCRLWIPIDKRVLTTSHVLELLGPLTASFGNAPFAELLLEDDPNAVPTGDRIVRLPAGAELPSWDVGRFRSVARSVRDPAPAKAHGHPPKSV